MAVNRGSPWRYDLEAWVHMSFYRLAVLYSFVHALITALYLGGFLGWAWVKASLVVYWLALTPSFYNVNKGGLMLLSRGAALSHLAENVKSRLRQRFRARAVLGVLALYAALAFWAAALVAFIALG